MWSASSRIVTSMRAEVAVALLDQVLEPAGAGDDDVEAAGERLHLRVLADAAEDRRRLHAEGPGQRVDDGRDLVGQLAGRHQDQRARALGLAAAVRGGEAGDQREAEGEGLAAAGAAAAEHVLAGEAVGQRRDLDRERRGDPAGGEHLDQRRGDAEGLEGGVGGRAPWRRPPTGRRPRGSAARPAGRVWFWVGRSPVGRRRGRGHRGSAGDGCPRSRRWTWGRYWVKFIGSSTLRVAARYLGERERRRACTEQGGLTSSARRRSAGRTSVAQPQPDVDSCRSG